MKIVKANKNKLRVTLSKTEWQQIGKKAGWVKKADTNSKYLAAVQQNGYALKNIPQEDITLELCSEAVRQNSGAIKYVPHNMKIELVRKNGEFIKYIPKDSLTLELCSEAVRQSPAAIEYVPHHFKKHLR